MNSDQLQIKLDHPERFHIRVFDQLPSTNDYLFEKAREGFPEWSVIIADAQTRGKGRMQRQWESPPGLGCWFSILLKPEIPPHLLNLINLFVAYTLAVYLEREIQNITGLKLAVDLKWPNDLLMHEKKLCGILLESNFLGNKLDFLVTGIGFNVNQATTDFSAELRSKATSLKIETGREWQRENLLAGFLNLLREEYEKSLPDYFSKIPELYSKKVLFRNQPIIVETGARNLKGIFRGITPEGYLILEQQGEKNTITAGDVFPEKRN